MSEFNGLGMNLGNLSRLSRARSRSISAENFTGEKGKAGMATEGRGAAAARDLGSGWKISPAIAIAPGQTFVLAATGPAVCAQRALQHHDIPVTQQEDRVLVDHQPAAGGAAVQDLDQPVPRQVPQLDAPAHLHHKAAQRDGRTDGPPVGRHGPGGVGRLQRQRIATE